MPFSNYKEALEYAKRKVNETRVTWYVNGLASSGPMQYAVSRFPITDTSFGGRVVETVTPTDSESSL